jgi:O-antigen ligase
MSIFLFDQSTNGLNKVFLYSIIGIIVTLPYNLLANNIFIGLLIIAWLSSGNWEQKLNNLIHNKFFYIFSALFIINIIGLSYTNYFESGLAFTERRLTMFLFPLIFFSSKHLFTSHNVKTLLIAFSIVMVGGSLFSHINIIIEIFSKHQSIMSLFGSSYTHTELSKYTNLHAGYFSMYNSFSILILIYYSYSAKYIIPKIAGILLSLYLLFFNLMLASRIGLLAMAIIFIAIAFYFIFSKRNTKITISLFLFSIISFSIIINLFPDIKTRLYENPKEVLHMKSNNITVENFQRLGSILFRLQIYDCSLSLLKYPNFIWGYGTGGADNNLQNCYDEKGYGWIAARNFNSHNQYLDQLLQHGILGLLIFVVALFYPLKSTIATKDSLYAIFLILIAISAFTESILNVQKGIVFYTLFNSILATKILNNE